VDSGLEREETDKHTKTESKNRLTLTLREMFRAACKRPRPTLSHQ